MGYVLAALAAVCVASYFRYLHVWLPKMPPLGAALQRATIRVGDRDRGYAFYAPRSLPPNAPLLFALHGSGSSGEGFRQMTGYRFDELADHHGFLVVYPDGFEGHWDDCRKAASYSARTLRIDDVGFIGALIERLHATYRVDASRVFAVGHSNGGQMSFRLALEMPEGIRAVAAVSAGLPTPENDDCQARGKPISVLIMNGTEDPINPFEGGPVRIFGVGDRGTVRSSEASARYFAALSGMTGEPSVEQLGARGASVWVERSTWGGPPLIEVVLDAVHGGGHTVPQGVVTYPRILGATAAGFDGPAEIWSFFARQGRKTPP